LEAAFEANVTFNGMILGVLLFGIVYIFWQVLQLKPEIDWLEKLRQQSRGGFVYAAAVSEAQQPRLLGPMANMLGERTGRISLSALSLRTLLDGIQSRIEEKHEISRYLIGLLVLLGLLGTFWGLMETVGAVGGTIAGLSSSGGDTLTLFEDLKRGLETPLSGMGTAFSSSLFGLGGSLILGFLELQAGQAHNRFFNELEEWLSGQTRLSSGAGVADGEQSVPAYIQALLEKTADSLDELQRTVARGEADRNSVNQSLHKLTEQMGSLADQLRGQQALMRRLSEADFGGGFDEATRAHIRNVDLRLEQLVNDAPGGRDHIVQELRSEIRLLTRTIAAIAEESEQG
ncbi:MAG: flagellar motor protein MotA, partial [Kiloniellales bacterium]